MYNMTLKYTEFLKLFSFSFFPAFIRQFIRQNYIW